MSEPIPTRDHNTTFQKAAFLGYLLVVTFVFIYMLRHFLMPVFMAGIFTGLTYPFYQWLLNKIGKRAPAALLTLLALVLLLVLPFIAIGAVAYREAVEVFKSLDLDLWRNHLESVIQNLQHRFPGLLKHFDAQNLSELAFKSIQSSSQFIFKHSADISISLADNVLSFFLMLFIMFYFYIDGPKILQRLIKWSPIKDEYERILIDKFVSVSKATLKGFFAIGIMQGFVGTTLFWAVGMHSPIFLGVLMVFASLVPAIGTAIVWAPVALLLLFQGHWISALVVIGVGGVIISSVDNLVRPMVVGKDIKMHDLLVLLSTLGGLGMFGLAGFIIGPIIAALFLAIWNIYEDIFADEIALNISKEQETGEDPKT